MHNRKTLEGFTFSVLLNEGGPEIFELLKA
jgi:hypothetical protein